MDCLGDAGLECACTRKVALLLRISIVAFVSEVYCVSRAVRPERWKRWLVPFPSLGKHEGGERSIRHRQVGG